MVAHQSPRSRNTTKEPYSSGLMWEQHTKKAKEKIYEPITAAEKQSITAEHRLSLVYAA